MTRIKNKSKIPLAIPNLDDYFIGSKQDNNGKTVNFDFNSVIGTINSANGLSTISYKFSTTEDATTEAGYFNTNGDEVDFGSITQIVISDTDYNGVDLSSLLSNLVDNKETILLYLKNPATQDLYSYFKVTLGVISTDYATLTVERLGTLSLGSLTDDTSYTLGFITVPESTQSDFAIDDVSSPAHILNRPTNTSDFTNDGEGLDRFVEEAELGDVAFSNDYDDLNNRITTTGEITNNGEGLDRFVEDQELGEVAFSNEYEDLDNKPVFKVVENEYANMAALYADRGNQTNTFIQYVLDASAHPDVTSGAKYFEYLGTTVGDNSDYRLLTDEESAPIGTNIAKTSDIPLNDGEDGSSRFIEEDELGLVAITDDYEDLVNTPENLSDFTDDIGAAEAIEGTSIKSTGEVLGSVLRSDGDNTCSWVALDANNLDLTADQTITGNFTFEKGINLESDNYGDHINLKRFNNTAYITLSGGGQMVHNTIFRPLAGNAFDLGTPTETYRTIYSNILSSEKLRLSKSYTVSTLPSGTQGDIAYVTDASSVTYRAIATGGGSDFALVVYNGTNWIYH